MTPIKFLKKELEIIAKKFPNVHIKYGFNSAIDTHIVELLPIEEYNDNKELDNAWIDVSMKFLEAFENEDIAFISSDSSLKISEVILEYNENYTPLLFPYFSQVQANLSPLGFPIYGNGIVVPEYNILNSDYVLNGFSGLPAILKYHESYRNILELMSLDYFVNPINKIAPTIEITTGNTSHAMAA
ncbi:MAG TPA: hypothetical protein VK718_03900 [Ferruginibacter sp.]|jgi:hypothetical protein|nr:hypothetical protein [Ferruginibacter sp.]